MVISVFLPALAAASDLNGDGRADILWRSSTTGGVSMWLMNGLVKSSNGSPGRVRNTGVKIQ